MWGSRRSAAERRSKASYTRHGHAVDACDVRLDPVVISGPAAAVRGDGVVARVRSVDGADGDHPAAGIALVWNTVADRVEVVNSVVGEEGASGADHEHVEGASRSREPIYHDVEELICASVLEDYQFRGVLASRLRVHADGNQCPIRIAKETEVVVVARRSKRVVPLEECRQKPGRSGQ